MEKSEGIHGSLMLSNDTAEYVRSAAPYLYILTFSLKPQALREITHREKVLDKPVTIS